LVFFKLRNTFNVLYSCVAFNVLLLQNHSFHELSGRVLFCILLEYCEAMGIYQPKRCDLANTSHISLVTFYHSSRFFRNVISAFNLSCIWFFCKLRIIQILNDTFLGGGSEMPSDTLCAFLCDICCDEREYIHKHTHTYIYKSYLQRYKKWLASW
jgi:hypothetical protein